MQSSTLLYQGAELMLVGMGTVFAFLTLLVFATTAMSRLVVRLVPEPAASPARSPSRPAGQPAANVADEELIAVISAAISLHRARRD